MGGVPLPPLPYLKRGVRLHRRGKACVVFPCVCVWVGGGGVGCARAELSTVECLTKVLEVEEHNTDNPLLSLADVLAGPGVPDPLAHVVLGGAAAEAAATTAAAAGTTVLEAAAAAPEAGSSVRVGAGPRAGGKAPGPRAGGKAPGPRHGVKRGREAEDGVEGAGASGDGSSDSESDAGGGGGGGADGDGGAGGDKRGPRWVLDPATVCRSLPVATTRRFSVADTKGVGKEEFVAGLQELVPSALPPLRQGGPPPVVRQRILMRGHTSYLTFCTLFQKPKGPLPLGEAGNGEVPPPSA
jgi:hypothetical protein